MATLTPLRLLFFSVFMCYLLQLEQGQASAIPTVGFVTNSTSKTETSRLFSIKLKRTVETNLTKVTVNLTGTAVRGSDYVVLVSKNVQVVETVTSYSLEVTFPAGDTSQQEINFFIINDVDVEPGSRETIVLTIIENATAFNNDNYTYSKVFIADNDVSIKCSQNVLVSESAGPAKITITRSGSSQSLRTTHEIGCFTKDGTAVESGDYVKHNTDLFFSSGNNVKKMSINIEDDDVPEGNETLKVRCYTNDARVQIDSSCKNAVVTIQNEDTYAFFCPGGYAGSVVENAVSYSVDICRVGVLSSPATVQLCTTSDGAPTIAIAKECNDVTFAANKDRISAPITITDDTVGESELLTFQIYLESSASKVKINDTTRKDITLKDNDNTFYLTDVTELTKTEGDGSAAVNLTIERNGKISVASSVSLELKFTATAVSADCSGTSPRVIQFNANETSKTITACTVVDDSIVEDHETFKVKISGVGSSKVKSGKLERTIKLISNDVNVACEGTSLKEANGPANVKLKRTGATAITANSIQCSTTNGTAFSSIDYQSQISATVDFALNDVNKNFPVVLTNDRVVEGNESFTVTCTTSDTRVVVDSSCSGIEINIINDDTYVYFCPGYSSSIEENAESYTVRLCRVGVLEDTHTVKLCRSSDSVSPLHDYPAVQVQCDDIVFTAYDEVKEHVIPVTNDTWGEQEYKTFNIIMSTTDAGVTFNDTTSYVVTIHDDDNTFCFTRTSATVYEEHDKFVNLTIRRTGEISMSSASVIINTSPQTAITPEDYTEPILNQRLTFFAGEIEKNISVNIVNDKLVEDDQTFQLSLTGVDGSTVFPDCKTSTVTIVSNDVNIFCRDRRGFQSVLENKGPVLMEFTREGSLQYKHTMRIRTIDGSAKSGEDYAAIDKTLTFAPYQTSIKENIVLVNDNVLEPDETFRLSVTSSDDRVHMICPGTDFTILNDDTFVRCANQSIEVSEGNRTISFTLKREGVLNKASPIWFSTKDGTAFDKSDYKPQNKVSKTFLPGQVYMTLSVDLVDDEYNEDDETFSVIIGSYVPTTLTSGDKCTLFTVKDNDPNRMTEQQAQELLDRRRNFLIILGVAGAFMALVVILFICCIFYFLRRSKKRDEKE